MPQLEQYLRHCREDIEIQFETNANSIAYAVSKLFGGGDSKDGNDNGEYTEATAEDIDLLARVLGG